MGNNERIESKELKEYLIKFAVSKLEDFDLFTKTFGKGFVKRRLYFNLDKVYIGKKEEKVSSGYYEIENLSITLDSLLEEKLELTSKDIENDTKLQAYSLHELIHAILTKTKLECKLNGIENGTGIFEKDNKGNQLGRGLNEGLTNWICEKVNLQTYTYKNLTNFVKLLELAIGEKRVIKFGKGNIRKNVAKQLKMTPFQTTRMLSIADDVYRVEDRINKIEYILQVLNDYSRIDTFSDEEKDKIEKEYQKVISYPLYISLFKSEEWKWAIKERLYSENLKDQKTFLKRKIEDENELLGQDMNEFQEMVFCKYFKKMVDECVKMQEIPFSKMKVLDELYKLINVYNQAENENLEIARFKEQYNSLQTIYDSVDTSLGSFRNRISNMSKHDTSQMYNGDETGKKGNANEDNQGKIEDKEKKVEEGR